jgi:hypothetical protein
MSTVPSHVQEWQEWRKLADIAWCNRDDDAPDPEKWAQRLHEEWFTTRWGVLFLGKEVQGTLHTIGSGRVDGLDWTLEFDTPIDGVVGLTAPFEHFYAVRR